MSRQLAVGTFRLAPLFASYLIGRDISNRRELHKNSVLLQVRMNFI
jgi:hypothetical protein